MSWGNGGDAVGWVIASDQGDAYEETWNALRAEWPGMRWRRFTPASLPPAGSQPLPRIAITLGSGALRALLERMPAEPGWSSVPVMAGLLPRAAYESLRPANQALLTAVWLDPPVDRYLELVRRAMPERLKVGVLFGPTSRALRPLVVKAAYDRGLELIETTVQGDDLYPALAQVLRNADVVLALPDSVVYNANTFNNILIASYRQRVPLVSYAASHVKAGATLALHVTPTQAGRQLAALGKRLLSERRFLPPQPASDATVAVNLQVARSLGLSVEDPVALGQAVMRAEGRP